MKEHFLQSREWEAYEKLEGHEVFRVSGEGFEVLAVVHMTPMGKYLFCPYGPTLRGENFGEELKRALSSLAQLAREQEAFFVRIEPTVPLGDGGVTEAEARKLGLKKSHDLEPANTWVVDLAQSREELLAGMEDRKMRNWKNHEKKGVSVRKTKDPEEITVLSSLLKGVGERNHFKPQDEEHLKNQLKAGFATLYIAEFEGKAIAASLIYDYDGLRYAVHAGADDNYRKLAAGTVLSIQEMLDAQEAGGREFDFWGITTSEDKSHPWYGFTQYKKSFGGRQVDYMGTWDLPVNKMKYKTYQMMRGVNRMRRR